jgi:hypothetical protein
MVLHLNADVIAAIGDMSETTIIVICILKLWIYFLKTEVNATHLTIQIAKKIKIGFHGGLCRTLDKKGAVYT